MRDLSGFKGAFEGKDLDSLASYFAPNAILHSPFTTEPLEGRETVRMVLGIILETLEDARYTHELSGPDGSAALVVSARVLDQDIDIVDLIGFDQRGRIDHFTVFVRPRKAGEALLGEVAPRIAKHLQGSKA